LDNSTSGKNTHENQPPSEGYYHLDSETKKSFDYVPETILSYIQSVATKQQKLFKILLDTGTSASLIRETILAHKDKRKLQKDEQGPTLWKTHGGSFTTTTTINLCYKLIEFTPHRNLDHNFKVDNTPKQNSEESAIIIGRDIIHDLGVDFKILTAIPTMSWDNISIPMWIKGFWSKEKLAHVEPRIGRG